MGASFRAELLILRKWPTVRVLVLLGPFITFLFGYFMRYTNYLTGALGERSDVALANTLPDNLVQNVVRTLGVYTIPVGLVLGALVAGSEYGRGTLKTALTQRPGRLPTYAGKALALFVVLATSVVGSFVVGAVCSLFIASIRGSASPWPAALEVARGMGALLLVFVTWASFGMALGVLFRGAALAIGVGLGWLVAIEAPMEQAARLFRGAVKTVYEALLGANTNTVLFSVFGNSAAAATPTNPTSAPWVLAAYVVVFLTLGALLLVRRDVV